ncbi:PREDICTED: uncharacterized protein LOC106813687 [Priapulus caudatus]|uniref:Uncharacterized protein LOC106813687 n=1 Tax=Priapulus caudatus TaxID=37621 RepID=A0ABM1EMG2_PRICU|nr:PREDICTED: uncharacterized protein LOC106813687 [Priapulus caudatus]
MSSKTTDPSPESNKRKQPCEIIAWVKKRKMLHGDESSSVLDLMTPWISPTVSSNTSSDLKKAGSNQRDHSSLLEDKNYDATANVVCQKCVKYERLSKMYRQQVERNKALEKELKHYKDVSDAGILVQSLKSIHDDFVKFSSAYSFEESQLPQVQEPTTVYKYETMPSAEQYEEITKVDIGRGILLDETSLLALANVKSATSYARCLLQLVFEPHELIGKSLTGKKSNAFKDSKPKAGLDPCKVDAVVEHVCQKYGPSIHASAIRASLANKLKELNKVANSRKMARASGFRQFGQQVVMFQQDSMNGL